MTRYRVSRLLQKSITLILVCIALLTACEEPAPVVSSTIITNAVIHKMTSLSAASMGIEHRGRIRTGYYADLVLFDPDTIEDTATMENSTAPSVGIEKVWVNGVLAFDDGEPTLVFAGRVVTRSNN